MVINFKIFLIVSVVLVNNLVYFFTKIYRFCGKYKLFDRYFQIYFTISFFLNVPQ